MYEFIILGLIPGTHAVVTFSLWLQVAGLLLGLFVVRRLHRTHLLRNALITLVIRLATRRQLLA